MSRYAGRSIHPRIQAGRSHRKAGGEAKPSPWPGPLEQAGGFIPSFLENLVPCVRDSTPAWTQPRAHEGTSGRFAWIHRAVREKEIQMRIRSGRVSLLCWGLVGLILCLAGMVGCSAEKSGVSPDQPLPAPAALEPVQTGPIPVPDLFGMTRKEAIAKLEGAGLIPAVETELSFDFKLNGMHCRVLGQTPLPGRRVAAGTKVLFTVYMPVGTCQ
jgi:hypothetical protein